MSKRKSIAETSPQVPASHEIREDEPLNIPVTQKELDALTNAVRALELMRAFSVANCEQPLVYFDVLLDNFSMPAWEVVDDLEGRFRQALDRLGASIAKKD